MLDKWAYRLLFFTAFQLHLSFALLIDRFHTTAVLASFAALWLVFLIQWADQKMSIKKMLVMGMLLRGVYIFSFPELSDDFWRYLWDGMLVWAGISPYEFLPIAWETVGLDANYGKLLPFLNSPEYYSVYPPVLQFVFGLSAQLAENNPLAFVIILRSFVLVAEFGSMVLIWRLLKAWRVDERNLMLYALNPLVIIEFTGNLHGEVFMVFFLLLSLFMLSNYRTEKFATAKKKWLRQSDTERKQEEILSRNSDKDLLATTRFKYELHTEHNAAKNTDQTNFGSSLFLGEFKSAVAAIAFGFSVATKLLPLMFLPFYIKRLGWIKTMQFATIALATLALLYVPFWTTDLVPNVLSSVRLYFASFEFNASVYYVFREIGTWYSGYNQIALIGRLLSFVVLAVIFFIAWRSNNKQISGLPELMLFAWFVYYALSTTVNPWYVAVLAAFLPFTKYWFVLLWLMLVPLSYHAFGNADYYENPWLLAFQYIPVYGWMLFELNVFAPIQRRWALHKAAIKRNRLLPFLSKQDLVLDVGVGNGALAVLLRNEGVRVQPLDIADKSLFKDVAVRVYDGTKFPYQDKRFGVCQLITMLHHTRNAHELIGEAKRVSNRIIIMEDIYDGWFQKYLTWFTDSIVNWEFYGHPHTNRTDAEWRELFEQNGLKVERVEYYRFLIFFTQVTYELSHANA